MSHGKTVDHRVGWFQARVCAVSGDYPDGRPGLFVEELQKPHATDPCLFGPTHQPGLMATDLRHRTQSRLSLRPASVAFLLGAVLHALDQAVAFRAGPVPILATAPAVAVLTSLHFREASYQRLAALLVWGVVASGAAVLGLYLLTVNYTLPRPLTGMEMVAYDFGMFLWFVLALVGTYVAAARRRGRAALLALLLSPVVQCAFAVVMVVLVGFGLYA